MEKGLLKKSRFSLFFILLMVACFLMTSVTFAQNYTVDISSYNSFRNQVYGHAYDIDNQYGYQCWDGAALLWQQLGRSLITGNGAAAGTWDNAQTNAGNDFDLITGIQNVKRGDVVVFGYDATYFNAILDGNIAAGHIAFADEDYDGSGKLNIMGQNQLGVGAFSVQRVGVSAFRGAFRLKNWSTRYGFDYPANNLEVNTNTFLFQGWVMPENKTISSITCSVNDGQRYFETILYSRPDVPGATAFRADIPYSILDFGNNTVSLCVNYSDGTGKTLEKRTVKRVIADAVDYPVNNTTYKKGVDKITLQGWSVDQTRTIDHFTYRINNGNSVYMNANVRADLMDKARAFLTYINTTNMPVGKIDIVVYVHFTDGVVRDIGKKTVYCREHDHNLTKTAAKAPTCTEKGNIEYYTCSICNKYFTNASGTIETSLANTVLPAIGHKPETIPAKKATCENAGLTEGSRCSVCGNVITAQQVIPATGHAYGEWTVVKEATYDAEGMEQRVCKHDASHIETRIIVKKVKPAETEVKPGDTNPAQPGTQIPTQPETQAPTQPETQVPTQPEPQVPQQTEKTPAVVVTPETEINETAAPTASAQQKTILAQKNDNDPKGSTFGSLQAKAVKVTKSSIRVQWKKVKGATKYVVYGNKCGKSNRYKKLKTVKTTSYTQKKLKKGTYYKYLVVAIKGSKAIATSKTIHAATTGGKVGNNKSVKVNKKSFSIGVGNKVKLEATAVAASNKLKVKNHRAIAFESSNKNIATVSKKGIIKGVQKGTCYVYAYAQNGVMAKVKVVVS